MSRIAPSGGESIRMADGDARTLHSTTEAATPATVFSGTDADVLTGSISGMTTRGDYIDVTFSGGDVLSLPLECIAQDQGTDGFTTIPIPPMKGVSKIEVTGAYDVVGALIVEA